MSPEDVPTEWVETAARAIHEARCCPLDQDSDCYGEHLYVESDQARHALAVVLPLAQAAAFEGFAARVRARWAKDGERCPWVGALDDEAARLREGSLS